MIQSYPSAEQFSIYTTGRGAAGDAAQAANPHSVSGVPRRIGSGVPPSRIGSGTGFGLAAALQSTSTISLSGLAQDGTLPP
jgi:hypothetical protein